MKLLSRKWLGPALIGGLLLYSCASVGRLEGGPRDEDPPVFLGGSPAPGELNNTKKKISIQFDEFIKLDKANENVVISPPQVQQPVIKASGKKVVITLEDTLKANTTYTIDFGDAIQDNNEGNPLTGFIYTFSTGERLDTMAVSGTVLNAMNLEPVKGMLVGLYANLADTAFRTLPMERVGRTDSRGRFSIRGVAPGQYHIFALQDADQNYFFSQPMEMIAFDDSLVIPTSEQRWRQDTTWIDSLTIDTIVERLYTHYLPDDVLLRCFKEKVKPSQRLARSERLVPNKFSLYFTAPADTLPLLRGLNFDEQDAFVIEQTTGRNDTLHYWLRDSALIRLDTLQMSLSYLYTDTLEQLVPRTDTLRLVSKQKLKTPEQLAEEKEKEEKKRKRKKKDDEEEAPQTEFLKMDVYAPGTIDIYDYLSLTFEEPVIRLDTAALHLQQKVDTLWQDVPFDLERDSIDLKLYNIYADWEAGESYAFSIDSAAITGLYGLHTDKVKKEMKVKKPEEYGQIFFNISGVSQPAFVELLDTQDRVLRQVTVEEGRADFYFLNPGKYGARLVEDTNGNGVWDTGNYEQHLQPERVFYYYQVLELKANFDLVQTWNVDELPPDRQKPDEMKKQKPDEKKKGTTGSSRSR